MDPAPTPLPDLQQSILDAPTVDQLFADIAACGSQLEIIPKFAAEERIDASSRLTLEDGRALLLAGQLRALQIRYRYQGSDWWDTLLPVPQGHRLVRIEHPGGEEAEARYG